MALQKLDLEEQEKLDALKAWWRENGRLIVLAVVAGAVAVAGVNGWRWHQHRQSLEAGRLYEALAKAARGGDVNALRETGDTLATQYPRTRYASMGALAMAHFHFERGELKSTKTRLQWVIEHSASEEFRDLARLRLAAVLLDEKALDEALKLLDAKPQEAFAGQYAALRGDVLVAKQQPQEARAAYRQAMEKTDPASGAGSAFRESVQMRLDALGG
jgi:predicted negative regulator of RcsB-dependent stress response